MANDPAFDSLDARLRAAAAEDAFSGVVVVRGTDGPLYETALGLASRRWRIPVRPGTRFDCASVTKLFTSVAVLQQVGEGRLDLDASITEYVDLDGTTISPAVTLRHLLLHTSGIADDADEEAGESYEALFADTPCYSIMRTEDLLPGFAHKPPNFAPGEGCRYCNAGYVLAGLALERVTGTGYRDYVRARVFPAAGMATAGFWDRRDPEPDVAEGWDPVRDESGQVTTWRENIFSYPPIGSPDGGAHVAAGDLLAFAAALRAGTLLPAELAEAYLTPQVLHSTADDGDRLEHSFGLEFQIRADGTLKYWEKEGINVGASAMLRHYPTQEIDLVVLSNSEAGAWDPVTWADEAVEALGR